MNPVAVLDFETDPFEHRVDPMPFAWGLHMGSRYVSYWEKRAGDTVPALLRCLEQVRKPHVIYAHNGGRFDFMYLLEHLQAPIRIINGRIVEARILHHTLRDSYSIIPIPLKGYNKGSIDYAKFKAQVRSKHRREILDYLRGDCDYLFDLVSAFVQRFGDALTVGSVALAELRKRHPVILGLGARHDEKFRHFYFGGRVEAFEKGVLSGDFSVYDVNSMYPYVMSTLRHPNGSAYSVYKDKQSLRRLKGRAPYFVEWQGYSGGAMPVRDARSGALSFPRVAGTFCCTGHEYDAAEELGLIQVERVVRAYVCEDDICFDTFVADFMREKVAAKQAGDRIAEIFSKLILNSAYGKFAQNPANYSDWTIRRGDDPSPNDAIDSSSIDYDPDLLWHPSYVYPHSEIWERPSSRAYFNDVAIGASITGAARSVLMRALHGAVRPVYCDTDSIICEHLGDDARLHDTELGAWKLEARGDTLALAGKKLYALYKNGTSVKSATKGFRLEKGEEKIIMDIARGGEYTYRRDAPTIMLDGSMRYVERRIKSTL